MAKPFLKYLQDVTTIIIALNPTITVDINIII